MWLPSSPYLSCGRTPGGPVGACTARAPFGHGRVVRPAPSFHCLLTLPQCSRGGVLIPLPSSPLSPLSSSFCSTHVAGMTQARAAAAGGGGGFSHSGPPFPRGRALHQRPLRAHVTPAPPRSPRFWSPSSRFLPLARWYALFVVAFFFFFRRQSLPLARRSVLRPPPMSPRHPLAVLAPFLGGWGCRGWSGGGAPSLSFLRRKHVAGTALAQGAAFVPLLGSGACRVARVVALPTLRLLHRCPPRWGLHGARFLRTRSCGPSRTPSQLHPHLAALSSGGGAAVRPSFPSSPTLGGAEVCVGGGLVVFPSLHTCHRHDASRALARGAAPVPLQGGGACLAAPVVALSTLRSHPRWSPRRGMHGACPLRARSCGPSCTLLPLPPYPAALSPGGGSLFAPPLPAFPALGRAGLGGGREGRPCLLPFVARTSQARRRHDTSTG